LMLNLRLIISFFRALEGKCFCRINSKGAIYQFDLSNLNDEEKNCRLHLQHFRQTSHQAFRISTQIENCWRLFCNQKLRRNCCWLFSA